MPSYIPLGTKVLLKKLPKPEQKQGTIITLNEPKDKLVAQVISYGENLQGTQWGEFKGLNVRYAPYTAHVIDESDPDYLIIDDKDIWCIVRE